MSLPAFVILSVPMNLLSTLNEEILRSLCSLRMTTMDCAHEHFTIIC